MKSMIIPGTFAHKSQYIYWGTGSQNGRWCWTLELGHEIHSMK